MKILAFAASNHKESINRKLLDYTVGVLREQVRQDAEVEFIDLIDYELPFYRQDREQENGVPELAREFYKKIGQADAVIISFAEHNGLYSAVYKNLFDWASRINQHVYQDKPMVLMATSPGGRGGANVLRIANEGAPHFGMDVKATVSVPSFQKNYDAESGEISNPEIREQILEVLRRL